MTVRAIHVDLNGSKHHKCVDMCERVSQKKAKGKETALRQVIRFE